VSNNGCTSSGNTTINPGGFVTVNTFFPTFYIPTTLWPVAPDLSPPYQVVKQNKVKIGNAEGYECTGCKDFYPMAELNQPENSKECTTFTCYSCRNGLSIIYK
jgi:hypothetical protein